MQVKKIIVVVPVYKRELSSNESISLERGLTILNRYSFALVAPEHLDICLYDKLFKEHNVEYAHVTFDDSFFVDISGYNRLLLSQPFYESFCDYTYMLIYQPDAYVFDDKLEQWCNSGYDYVGAPLIGDFHDTEFSDIMRVGNGGFSLRKIAAFIEFFHSRRNVFNAKQIIKKINIKKKPYTRLFVFILMLFGWRNKPKTVASRWIYNEDDFWSGLLDNSRYALKKPSPKVAIEFAFERFPSSLFKLNGEHLPFGCHAWTKYEFETFWSKHIETR